MTHDTAARLFLLTLAGTALLCLLAVDAPAQVDSSGRFVGNAATANLGTGSVNSPNLRLQESPKVITLVCEREDQPPRDIASGASVTFESGGFWLVDDAVYVPERGELCFPEAR